MTEEQAWAFLRGPKHPAVLATTRRDGRPHAVPVSFILDGEVLTFCTGSESLKGRNMARDDRVSICVQDDTPPGHFVSVEGRVTLSSDPADLLDVATRVAFRGHGPGRADEFGKRNSGEGQLVVRVHVDRIYGTNNVSDYPAPS